MPQLTYLKPQAPAEIVLEIKKSRFIAAAIPISQESEAKAFLQKWRESDPGANHHCSAFISQHPSDHRGFGYSDDGEPSGTAGRPMYNVLHGANIGGICVIVTRYFGGIKLGTGGLVRAYSASVKELLPELTLAEVKPKAVLSFSYPYSLSSNIEKVLHSANATLIESHYGSDVMQEISIDIDQVEPLKALLIESCHGQLTIHQDES